LFSSCGNFHIHLLLRETLSRYRRIKLRAFAFVCNILCNSVARRAIQLIWLILALSASVAAHAQTAAPDDTCTKVRQVFVGLNDIAKKGNTKIVPFSNEYQRLLSSYFERGCPQAERFPLPEPGTDMSLANTASDVLTGGGGIKFKLGAVLRR
jgi:hypothetical protein